MDYVERRLEITALQWISCWKLESLACLKQRYLNKQSLEFFYGISINSDALSRLDLVQGSIKEGSWLWKVGFLDNLFLNFMLSLWFVYELYMKWWKRSHVKNTSINASFSGSSHGYYTRLLKNSSNVIFSNSSRMIIRKMRIDCDTLNYLNKIQAEVRCFERSFLM